MGQWKQWTGGQQRELNRWYQDAISESPRLSADEHLDKISWALAKQHFGAESENFRGRMARQIAGWLRDEGDTEPERLAYWYDVILDENGEDDFLAAALEVWAAIDRAAVQSILLACERMTSGATDGLPLSA